MKRLLSGTLAALAVSALLAGPVPASASQRAPAMAATTTVTSHGSHALVVTIARPATLGTTARELEVRSDGAWAGVFLVQLARHPITVGLVVARPPDGCGTIHCVHAEGYRSVASTAPVERGAEGHVRFRLPAGQYVLYAVAPPGRTVRGILRLAGLSGTASLRPRAPVTSGERAVRATGAGAATTQGSWPITVRRPSVLVLSTWRSTLPGRRTPTIASGKACLDTADGSESSASTCLLGTSRNQVGGIGANDVDSGGFSAGSWLNLRQAPGVYNVSYSLSVVGEDPAVGLRALWFSLR
jgi:hypothetical protein